MLFDVRFKSNEGWTQVKLFDLYHWTTLFCQWSEVQDEVIEQRTNGEGSMSKKTSNFIDMNNDKVMQNERMYASWVRLCLSLLSRYRSNPSRLCNSIAPFALTRFRHRHSADTERTYVIERGKSLCVSDQYPRHVLNPIGFFFARSLSRFLSFWTRCVDVSTIDEKTERLEPWIECVIFSFSSSISVDERALIAHRNFTSTRQRKFFSAFVLISSD